MSAKSMSPNRWQHIEMNFIQSSKLFVIITKYIITNYFIKTKFDLCSNHFITFK